MSSDGASGGWALRLHEACEWIWFTALINALWIAGTLAGGIVLGITPSSVTAATLIRRRLRGDRVRVIREFFPVWGTEFLSANLVAGPPMLISALAASGAASFTASHPDSPVGTICAVGAGAAAALAAIVVPLYVTYDLPRSRYLLTASRWMLSNLIHLVLLVVAAAVIVIASALLPGLIPVFSVGAWLVISTALCLGFFAANDRRIAAQQASETSLPRTLTTEGITT